MLATQGSYESDGGVQYRVTRRLQAAGPHGGDGVQHRATGRDQTAASCENEGGVQYACRNGPPVNGRLSNGIMQGQAQRDVGVDDGQEEGQRLSTEVEISWWTSS